MTKLVVLAHPDIKKIAVPVSASAEVDMLAEEFGLTVIKTRDSHLALWKLHRTSRSGSSVGRKAALFSMSFLFASDGMHSVSKLLECLALTRKRLGELDRETPQASSMTTRRLPASWNLKGQVMRYLMKDTERLPGS